MMMTTTAQTWRLRIEPERENEVRVCRDCGSDWVLTARNRDWFLAKQLTPPRRCERCRKTGKAVGP